jgi:hypothetical protein
LRFHKQLLLVLSYGKVLEDVGWRWVSPFEVLRPGVAQHQDSIMLVFRTIKFIEMRQHWEQDLKLKHEIKKGIPSQNLPPAEQGPASLEHLTQPLRIIHAAVESWWHSKSFFLGRRLIGKSKLSYRAVLCMNPFVFGSWQPVMVDCFQVRYLPHFPVA